MTEPLLRIVIGLIAILIGWAIGFFDSNMRTNKKVKEAEERAQAAVHQAKGEADRAIAAARSTPAAPIAPGKSLLRLWLDESQRPHLDLDDQAVDTSPISDAHRKRLIMLLNILRPWVDGKPVATPASIPPPPAPAAATSSPIFSAPKPIPAPAPVISPLAKKDEKPTAPLSMVAQIDEILQARLAAGSLAERAIRLMESPEGTVIVLVGLQKFNGVGEVTDPQIQAEIRAAIAEWEKKYTPGL